MSKIAEELAAWYAHGQALIAALPPINEEADRAVARAIAQARAKNPPVQRKLLKKRAP